MAFHLEKENLGSAMSLLLQKILDDVLFMYASLVSLRRSLKHGQYH